MIVGQTIGPFQIEKELGSGAMGTVYRAKYTKTGETVALKIIALNLLSNDVALARFERESKILKQLKHPHIVRLIGTGRWRKTPFIAMEYVDGESLDHVLARKGRFTWEEVAELGIQLCDALQHAHEKGIIHRDLKPSNLMVLSDDTVKLTDFGIAKDIDVTGLTGTNSTIGTAAYMSPEQCKGEKYLTGKSDLYSMGVVLYELLTGEKPFKAESTVEMFMAHVKGKFERPSRLAMDIPMWLDTLVCQLLEKKPEHRPLDAAMVKRSLEEILDKASENRSVGLDAVTGHPAQRSRVKFTEETDREAARTLRAAAKKKKLKKKKGPPFYRQVWFQGVAIAALFSAFAFGIYEITRPPSAQEMVEIVNLRLAQIQGDFASLDNAHEAVKNYLIVYGDRETELTQRMRELDRRLAVDKREIQIHNRFRKDMPPEEDYDKNAYKLTFAALEAEEEGDLQTAKDHWQSIIDESEGSWANLAEKKLRLIEEAHRWQAQLWERFQENRVDEVEPEYDTEAERLAVQAIRFTEYGDPRRAFQRWQEAKAKSEGDLRQRVAFLWSAHKVRELEDQLDEEEPEKEIQARLQFIDDALKKAESRMADEDQPANRRNGRNLARDILELYGNDPNANVSQLAQRAKLLLPEKEDS